MGRMKGLALAFWKTVLAPPPPMTYDQFLGVLHATPRTWRVTKQGWIRSEDGDCPLTKSCAHFTGRDYSPSSEWKLAAKAMRLPLNVARWIWPAADYGMGHDPKVRRDLLVATGIIPDPLDAELAQLVASSQQQAANTEERELVQV